MRPRAQFGAFVLAVVIAGCDLFVGSPMLEVRVTNESDTDVSVTISQEMSGIGQEFTERIDAGAEETISVEYPGPDPWTILVDEVPVTDSSEWPQDNPTVDLLIHISPDGTVEVIDG